MGKCELCGEPMPAGEEMFKYHGYSGDCPKPPLPKLSESDRTREAIRSSIKVGAPGLTDIVIDAIVRSAMMKIHHHAGVALSEENDRLMSAMREACDLLAERTQGSAARSPGHNARLLLEAAVGRSGHTE